MKGLPAVLKKRIDFLDRISCRRELSNREGIDFSSNDYLGFSQDPELRKRFSDFSKIPMGSSGSRLLRGNLKVFEESEEVFAKMTGTESALFYASGYQANVGLLSALLTPEDIVFSDQLNHASIIDGIKLSGAKKVIYPHLRGPHSNWHHLRKALEAESSEKNPHRLKVIVTESLFSMDGDLAPLRELATLAEEFSALLIVDEAHATGLWGDFEQNLGGGWVQKLGLRDQVFATIHPAGKALGVGGAWVSGSHELKDYLVNFSRSFIYSTAPVPWVPEMLKCSIKYWQEVGRQRAQEVLEKSKVFQTLLAQELREFRGQDIAWVPGPIIPIVIGENEPTLRIAQALRFEGFDVRAIRAPTVPHGQARLRVTVNYDQTDEQLKKFVAILGRSMARSGIMI